MSQMDLRTKALHQVEPQRRAEARQPAVEPRAEAPRLVQVARWRRVVEQAEAPLAAVAILVMLAAVVSQMGAAELLGQAAVAGAVVADLVSLFFTYSC